jgi:hypothetical protein
MDMEYTAVFLVLARKISLGSGLTLAYTKK